MILKCYKGVVVLHVVLHQMQYKTHAVYCGVTRQRYYIQYLTTITKNESNLHLKH